MKLVIILLCVSGVASNFRVLREKYISVTIGTKDCDVTKYGAKGDGHTDDTKAIQAALDDCGAKGGRVLVPSPGKYLITALELKGSNLELNIATGATLLVSDDYKHWPQGKDVISAASVHDVAITGGGTVDGQGLVWWREMKKDPKLFRPHMVGMKHVTNALLTDSLYLNAPNHVLEIGADFTEIARVKVLAPPSTGDCKNTDTCSHNTDAVDVHGDPFYIHHVNFTTGDDNVACHANNTLVEDSFFGTGHGASIGSLCDSWLRNITFRNITFVGSTAGARIKSHPNCAGHVWDVTYTDLDMTDVKDPILLTQYYDGTGPSTYLFEVAFKNINIKSTSMPDGNTTKATPSSFSTDYAIDFDCDTHYDGKANCHVTLDKVHLDVPKAEMRCQGVTGTSKDFTGIKSCLQKPKLP